MRNHLPYPGDVLIPCFAAISVGHKNRHAGKRKNHVRSCKVTRKISMQIHGGIRTPAVTIQHFCTLITVDAVETAIRTWMAGGFHIHWHVGLSRPNLGSGSIPSLRSS